MLLLIRPFLSAFIGDMIGWGKTSKKPRSFLTLRVPKRWFTHFYGFSVVWDCCILAYVVSIYVGHVPAMLQWIAKLLGVIIGHDTEVVISEQQWRFSNCQFEIVLALMLQTFQVARRFFECLYVSVFSDSQMHFLHYLVGYFFYTWTGATIVSQFATCGDLGNEAFQLKWYHLCGLLLFSYASFHQYKCHVILASIRTVPKSRSSQYELPRGDWFELVTSPHYFAEILLYAGIGMVQGFRNVWTTVPVISTTLLLLTGAKLSHEWYTEKYGDLVQRRCALIPFIY